MSAPAPLQSFVGLRALLLSPQAEPGAATRTLPATLGRLGMLVSHHTTAAALLPLVEGRDLLFIDGDDDLNTLLAPLPAADLAAVPVIGLVGIEAPGRLRALMGAGATAFLRKPVYGSAVYAALYLGVNAHRARRRAHTLLAEHERRRQGRKHLIRATLLLMQRDGLDDDAAYDALRRAAMRARISVEDYSQALLAESDVPPLLSKRTA